MQTLFARTKTDENDTLLGMIARVARRAKTMPECGSSLGLNCMRGAKARDIATVSHKI